MASPAFFCSMYEFHFILIPLFAFLLDNAVADPHWLPHPVRLIGRAASSVDAYRDTIDLDLKVGLKTIGFMTLGFTGLFTFWLILELTTLNIPWLAILFSIYFSYAGLSLQGLITEGWKVERALRMGNIDQARHEISMLVSRDTSKMNEAEIRRSLAETVSENFSDGFFAPFFYLVLFGPACMWVYKTINTFDSMWGYKTERYKKLGWFPAIVDDMANWIPARLSTWALRWAGRTMGLEIEAAARNTAVDARKMESPNAGWPMATCAWLVGGAMGGTTVYFGEVKEKPNLGPQGQQWTSRKIEVLFKLVRRAGWLTVLIASGLLFVLSKT